MCARPHIPSAAHTHAQVLDLLNLWQRDFPLVSRPFDVIAQALKTSASSVIAQMQALERSGALSRIGGVFAAQAGGAAVLAAMAVAPERLDAVAACVSAHPGVNHNYERENHHNLWFVVTAPCEATLAQTLQSIQQQTGLPALSLRMRKPYRIDLGFDLRHRVATARADATVTGAAEEAPVATSAAPVASAVVARNDVPLAALVEGGLPLVEQPFLQWAQTLGWPEATVLDTLHVWLRQGLLRRFGVIVRHHELGFDANAMTVFDVPDAQVDACGERLARCPEVTLAYQRERAAGWPYNLYCMVHGRDRATVQAHIEDITRCCGLADVPREILFSRRRFKQVGARRFRPLAMPETVSC